MKPDRAHQQALLDFKRNVRPAANIMSMPRLQRDCGWGKVAVEQESRQERARERSGSQQRQCPKIKMATIKRLEIQRPWDVQAL